MPIYCSSKRASERASEQASKRREEEERERERAPTKKQHHKKHQQYQENIRPPGFESGFGPTAMSEMARAVGLAQQRRNERCHGTTPTDMTDAEERPQLRHCAWSRKCPGKP